MKRLIGAAVVAGALAFAGPAAVDAAAAAAPQIKAQTAGASGATDFSAQRYHRRYYRYGYRPFIGRTTSLIITRGPNTIGRIPITRRRRSRSVSVSGRSGNA